MGIASDLKDNGAGIVIIEDFEEMVYTIINTDLDELGLASSHAVTKYWTWDALKTRWIDVLNHAG